MSEYIKKTPVLFFIKNLTKSQVELTRSFSSDEAGFNRLVLGRYHNDPKMVRKLQRKLSELYPESRATSGGILSLEEDYVKDSIVPRLKDGVSVEEVLKGLGLKKNKRTFAQLRSRVLPYGVILTRKQAVESAIQASSKVVVKRVELMKRLGMAPTSANSKLIFKALKNL